MDNTCFPTNQRLYPFDGYRVILLLLGFVFHSVVFLKPWEFFQNNKVFSIALYFGKDSFALNKLALFIHLFRMPAFFIVGGFFAEILIKKYLNIGFMKNRARRLFVPMGIFITIIYLYHLSNNYVLTYMHNQITGQPIRWAHIWPREITLGYLWFLEYLICMELAWLLLRFIFCSIAKLFNWNKFTISPGSFVLLISFLIIISVIPLLIYHPYWFFISAIDTKLSGLLWYGLHYFCFFLLGVIVVHFVNFQKYASWMLSMILILISCCFYLFYLLGFIGTLDFISIPEGILLSTLFGWFFSIGLLMFCFNICRVPNQKIKYLAQASYFLYLVQIPTIILLSSLTLLWDMPRSLLVICMMLLSFSVDLLIYQLFVRKRRWLSYIDGAKITAT